MTAVVGKIYGTVGKQGPSESELKFERFELGVVRGKRASNFMRVTIGFKQNLVEFERIRDFPYRV